MDPTQVYVLEQSYQVGLCCFLEGAYCLCLKMQISFKVLGDFPHQSVEGQLPDEQFRGPLIPANLTKSYCSWVPPHGSLQAPSLKIPQIFLSSCCSFSCIFPHLFLRQCFARSFGDQVLARGLSSLLSRHFLCPCHLSKI